MACHWGGWNVGVVSQTLWVFHWMLSSRWLILFSLWVTKLKGWSEFRGWNLRPFCLLRSLCIRNFVLLTAVQFGHIHPRLLKRLSLRLHPEWDTSSQLFWFLNVFFLVVLWSLGTLIVLVWAFTPHNLVSYLGFPVCIKQRLITCWLVGRHDGRSVQPMTCAAPLKPVHEILTPTEWSTLAPSVSFWVYMTVSNSATLLPVPCPDLRQMSAWLWTLLLGFFFGHACMIVHFKACMIEVLTTSKPVIYRE